MKFNWPIIGHHQVAEYLQKVVENGEINHAYLLVGPAGIGKNLMADYFIKSIFCFDKENKPCGKCAACRQIGSGVYPDVTVLTKDDDKKNIAIEQIRAIRGKIFSSSLLNGYKAVWIPEAGVLSAAAANGLLKILEEPAGKVVFVMVAERLSDLPMTIASRSQVLKFMPVARKEIEDYYRKAGYDREAAEELAAMAQGSPGRIINWLKGKDKLKEYHLYFKELVAVFSGGMNTRFDLAEKIAGQSQAERTRGNVIEAARAIDIVCRDILMNKYNGQQVINKRLSDELTDLGIDYHDNKILQIAKEAQKTEQLVARNINPRLALENLMLSFE